VLWYLIYREESISSSNADFVGSQRLIKAFQNFKILEMPQGKILQITPYVLTGSGEHITGKKQLSHLET